MAKAKSIRPTTIRLAKDTEPLVRSLAGQTGWSPSVILNFGIRLLVATRDDDRPALFKLMNQITHATRVKAIDDEAARQKASLRERPGVK